MSDSETFDTDMTMEYSNRILKNKAWENLCMKFYEDFHNKETKEKNQCTANLQRKWKILRDSFNRDLKKQNSQRSGSAGSSKRYYYFSQLLFLKPLSENRNTTSSLPVQNKDDDIEQIDNEDDNTTETSDSEVWKRPKNIQRKKDDAKYGEYGQGYTTPAYQPYERPSTSRYRPDMETGSPQLRNLRTASTPRSISVPESPLGVSSQASNYNDPIITDIFGD
ncbi:unnamed protein product [Parnassius mnemosyne]|uniref:MADF domain-containing protein n=1 Tax=Parnassius mnemosyne TaxID=213953 RepID=A0AAV1LVI6_9NEOP